MGRANRDWRTILLAIGSIGCAVLAFSSAALIAAYSLLGTFQLELPARRQSPLDVAVMASALIVIGAAFLPSAYYSIQRLRGRAVPAALSPLLRVWHGIVLVVVWLAAALGAQFLLDNPTTKWITPALYVLAIGVPVLFFARLATGGLQLGSRERLWGVLAAGMGLGIAPAIVAELLLGLLGLIGVGIYVALHPEVLSTVQRLANQLENATDLQQVLNIAGPWLSSPIAFVLGLLFFSGFSPLIEETSKSLATWAVFDRLTSPAQGFALGAISGAAFGLVESLLVSASPDASWAGTLLVRGASTMMHVMSASLTGWGIASFRTSKSFGKLVGMFLLAISLHAMWNASVVAVTFGGIRAAMKTGGPDPVGVALIFAGVAALAVLCLAIPLAMAGINRHLRVTAASSATASPALSEPSVIEADGLREEQAASPSSPPAPPL